MKIHIITPFFRTHLIPTLIHYLEPMGIEWHPVIGHDSEARFDRDWIHPVRTDELLPTDMCYKKIDDFADTQEIIDDDYYGFMGDDDMYEPEFFDVIREQTAKIIMFSVYRGDSIPTGDDSEPHPWTPIRISSIEDVRVCNIGMGMYIVKGEILKQNRFGNNHKWDDGRYAVRLRGQFPDDIVLLPDLFIFGNFFQPGRYNKKEAFLKPNWELPEII